MAPERIDPSGEPGKYDIRSDVWSLGISMIEMATGRFPYNLWSTPFEQLKQVKIKNLIKKKKKIYFNWLLVLKVVKEDPPRLEPGKFSSEFEDFITQCLQKDFTARPNYEQLLQHSFIVEHTARNTDISEFVAKILDLPE